MKQNSLALPENAKVVIEGVVSRIVFHNENNGFTVLRIIPEKGDLPQTPKNTLVNDNITCVGHMMLPKLGIKMRFEGNFIKNPRFGMQLSFDLAEEILPRSIDEISAYLSSGLIKGIGPSLAQNIVDKFGEDTFRILDEEPDRLKEVARIGNKNLETIKQTWSEHRGVRDLLIFLQPYGVTAAYAVKIYKTYGSNAKALVAENPFRLAMDVSGIGFITADDIGKKLGFAKDHPLRIQAAILYILKCATDEGHVFLEENDLIQRVLDKMNINEEDTRKALNALDLQSRIKREELKISNNTITAVYLSLFYHCETKIAFYLKRILLSPKSVKFENEEEILNNIFDNLPVKLAPEQIKAIKATTKNKALIITGGPGTGKTTIIKTIIKTFKAVNSKVLLAAPTGRAAKRMAEACGSEAKTIHRLLEFNPDSGTFSRNENNPLSCNLLVIDEASMIDTILFYQLLKAVPLGATLILVGDIHQLPSVGPGNVLGDIIDSKIVEVIELNKIFRQSANSQIVCNAHSINNGSKPILETNLQKKTDFYFIPQNDPEIASQYITELIKNYIPKNFGFDPVNEVQLLTPMHRGAVGAENMNILLQDALNPNGLEVKRGNTSFRLYDKVMQIKNNYNKNVFNGDLGRIVYIDTKEKILNVNYDGLNVGYEFSELDNLMPAYAISIHKSQGSEYPAVVIPIMMQHYILLQKNLVYTGITRGKKLVIIVGEMRAFQIAIHNNKTYKRNTCLSGRLKLLCDN